MIIYENQKITTLLTYSLVFITGLTFANLYVVVSVSAQNDTGTATGDEASVGETYTALLLAIFSLVGNIINWYLAEKAKRIGLNPNSTDERMAKAFLDFADRFKNSEQKVSELTDFIYSALPDKAQQIVNKPAIRISEVTKDVHEADQKVGYIRSLLGEIASIASAPPKK
jgi:hypothetical protein